jgi:hypothetical protein
VSQRIQFSRRRGARMPDGAVYVGRHMSPTYGRWGNPFLLGDVTRSFPSLTDEQCHGFVVNQFRDLIASPMLQKRYGYPSVEEIRAELAGKDLACWCPLDRPCHADVLLEVANATVEREG